MKSIGRAVLAVFIVTFGCLGARAQTQYNTLYGTGALAKYPYSGWYSSAFGYDALYSSATDGDYNTAAGAQALYWDSDEAYEGPENSASGYDALYSNTTGYSNTATGLEALYSNTTGYYNTATGYRALYTNTASYNTATGYQALDSNTSGDYNTAIGRGALRSNTTGDGNTATGSQALFSNSVGSYNSGIGESAGYANTTGNYNISIGYDAGYDNTTGSDNIDIGSEGESNDDGVIRIGGSPGSQTAFYAAGIYGANVSGVPVYITSSGQLGIVNSSIRFKKDVESMGDASSAIYRLRPVTYRYKKPFADGSDPVEYGLIAEEVAKVYPDLVARNGNGTIQTVEYQKLTPMMLNELQKQDPILEQMEKIIRQQKQAIQFLKAQQTESVQLLERRVAALEAASSSAMRLDARLETK